MKNSCSKVVLISSILLIAASTSYLFFQFKNIKPTQKKSAPRSATQTYTNTTLGFSIELPSSLAIIEDEGPNVIFKYSKDGPWILSITAEQTPLKTTKQWLRAKQVSDPYYRDMNVVQWIDPENNEKILLTEHIRIDPFDNDSAYEVKHNVVIVKNGTLYTINIQQPFNTNEEALKPEIMTALSTLQVKGIIFTDENGSYIQNKNSPCGILYTIPVGWVYGGWGIDGTVITISSPEDIKWDKEHPIMTDAGPAFPPISFYMSCMDGTPNIFREQEPILVQNGSTVEAALAKGLLKNLGNAQYLKTTEVAGQKAFVYEIGAADSRPDMHYDSVFVYLNHTWMEIRPSMTRFADITKDQQGILDSIQVLDAK